MDEMNLLTSMRDEVPLAPPSPAAERLFRAGLPADNRPERAQPTRPPSRYLPGGPGLHGRLRRRWLAVPGVLAAGLTAALVVLLLPPGAAPSAGQTILDPANGTPMSAQLLADIAGQAALTQPPVRPGQWVYQKIKSYSAPPPGAPSYVKDQPGFAPVADNQTQWVLADGAETVWGPVNGHFIGGLVLTGPSGAKDRQALASAARAYSRLSLLPKDPAALEAYFASKTASPHPAPALRALVAYSAIQNMLSSEILPPALTAELYHALADVPGVIAKKNVKDIAGRSGVEFILPQHLPYNINFGTILSATTYQYLGQASWSSPPYVWKKLGKGWSGPSDFTEQVLLAQALVSAPGKLP